MNSIPEPLKAERDYWLAKGGTYDSGISDRIRAMSLGCLVLIWGIFAGESKELVLSLSIKIALLCIGLGAVLVLLFDFVEYALGYKDSMIKAGLAVAPGYDVKKRKETFLHLKKILGILTLAVLVIVLGAVAISSVVHAAEVNNLGNFMGHWCGTRAEGEANEYMLLDITSSYGEPQAILDGKINCDKPVVINGEVRFICGNILIAGKRFKNGLAGYWKRGTQENSPHGIFSLVRCEHN